VRPTAPHQPLGFVLRWFLLMTRIYAFAGNCLARLNSLLCERTLLLGDSPRQDTFPRRRSDGMMPSESRWPSQFGVSNAVTPFTRPSLRPPQQPFQAGRTQLHRRTVVCWSVMPSGMLRHPLFLPPGYSIKSSSPVYTVATPCVRRGFTWLPLVHNGREWLQGRVSDCSEELLGVLASSPARDVPPNRIGHVCALSL
jgi:hypothetical protein